MAKLIRCKNCGGKIRRDTEFCSHCGAENKRIPHAGWWWLATIVFAGSAITYAPSFYSLWSALLAAVCIPTNGVRDKLAAIKIKGSVHTGVAVILLLLAGTAASKVIG